MISFEIYFGNLFTWNNVRNHVTILTANPRVGPLRRSHGTKLGTGSVAGYLLVSSHWTNKLVNMGIQGVLLGICWSPRIGPIN